MLPSTWRTQGSRLSHDEERQTWVLSLAIGAGAFVLGGRRVVCALIVVDYV